VHPERSDAERKFSRHDPLDFFEHAVRKRDFSDDYLEVAVLGAQVLNFPAPLKSAPGTRRSRLLLRGLETTKATATGRKPFNGSNWGCDRLDWPRKHLPSASTIESHESSLCSRKISFTKTI
jgi:hypothetical protein